MTRSDDRPPYGAYAAIMGTFAGGLAAAGALGRLLDRDPQCQTALDFAVLGAATFKAARTLARDDVTSFIREPFVEGEADEARTSSPSRRRPPAGDRRARHLHALRRHLGRGGPRLDADPGAALRPAADLVARRRGGERLPAGRLRRARRARRTSWTRRSRARGAARPSSRAEASAITLIVSGLDGREADQHRRRPERVEHRPGDEQPERVDDRPADHRGGEDVRPQRRRHAQRRDRVQARVDEPVRDPRGDDQRRRARSRAAAARAARAAPPGRARRPRSRPGPRSAA